jgi:hypothetical protein
MNWELLETFTRTHVHAVIILSHNYRLPHHVASFAVLTRPTQSTAHIRSGVAAGNDKRWLSDKTKSYTGRPFLFLLSLTFPSGYSAWTVSSHGSLPKLFLVFQRPRIPLAYNPYSEQFSWIRMENMFIPVNFVIGPHVSLMIPLK